MDINVKLFPALEAIAEIMLTIKISGHAVDGLAWNEQWNYIAVLAILNMLVVAISYLLFPYLWRD
jgi:heme exporter protein B